jgi:hypothetical protein
MRQEWQRKQTYQQISSIFGVQCKLNLQTDRFNLHKILTDELTTDQLGFFLETDENELTNRSLQIQNR